MMSFDEIPLKIRIANALVSYVKYVIKMVWPFDLAAFYPHTGHAFPLWQTAGAGALLVGISILLFRYARHYPFLLMGWLWYLGTLVPVIGLIQVGAQSMADRYSYVPLIGLFISIAWGVPQSLKNWRLKKFGLAIASVGLIAFCMSLTWRLVGYWRNSITLFEHTLEVTDNNYLFHNNLGVALKNQGRTREAIAQLSEAIRIKPSFYLPYNNLVVALLMEGRVDEAILNF